MSSISRIQAAIASATQETTLALASLNFDFSLVKVEAPAEYKAIGTALSKRRVTAAEHGSQHVTARRLGSLFESKLPSTPKLIQTYGTRASSIAQELSSKTEGSSRRYGPFGDFVGVDGTTIWAAATSGPSAIAVHLLACMLASVWPASEAVSIWKELVAERKRELLDCGDTIPLSSAVISQLDLTDSQLSEWDASARAWIRAADTARVTKSRQSKLKHLLSSRRSLAVNPLTKLYASVLQAWTTALVTMDKVVAGAPYSIQDGSVLVALLAWHLYPNIIVLGSSPEELVQDDDLISAGASITLGLENINRNEPSGVTWSLSLAHLRYYGTAINSSSGSLNHSFPRWSFEQFDIVVLGSLLGTWGISAGEITDAMDIILSLEPCFNRMITRHLPHSEDWMRPLANAVLHFRQTAGVKNTMSSKLLELGLRRPNFLSGSIDPPFGLAFLKLLSSLDYGLDMVQLLREIFRDLLDDRSDVWIIVWGKCPHDYSFYSLLTDDSWSIQTKGKTDPKRVDLANIDISGKAFLWYDPPKFFKDQEKCRFPENRSTLDKLRMGFSKSGLRHFNKTKSINRRKIRFERCFGILEDVALFRRVDLPKSPSIEAYDQVLTPKLSIQKLSQILRTYKMDETRLSQHAWALTSTQSLRAWAFCHYVCAKIPDVSISPRLIEVCTLGDTKWAPKNDASVYSKQPDNDFQQRPRLKVPRSQAFACLAMLDSGVLDLDPSYLTEVMAMSYEDSLYIAAPLLTDPYFASEPWEIRRVAGNIGRAGLALMIPPQQPNMRKTNIEEWNLINHEPFDGKLENCFSSTSLHLRFSGYERPFVSGLHGERFIESFFIETMVSVHDGGRWVADLDVLSMTDHPKLRRLKGPPSCKSTPAGQKPVFDLTSVDSWEELFESPLNPGVARAHGNWQARLALTMISASLGYHTVLIGDHGCWNCGHDTLETIHKKQEKQGRREKGDQRTDNVRTVVFVL